MRRVISIYLPNWQIEARAKRSPTFAAALDKPVVIADVESRQHTVLAVNRAAAEEGILPGMPVAHARAIFPNLRVAPAEPTEDARALRKLATGCMRFSPFVAPCSPDGIWIDATGCAHLYGGETEMVEKIAAVFARHRLTLRIAMAQTPGAAWAWSHFGEHRTIVAAAPGELNGLPITALRISPEAADGLWRVGVKTIADMRKLPRKTIPIRYGADTLRRLDQALGFLPESIDALLPAKAKQCVLSFAEPIAAVEDLQRTTQKLACDLCADLEKTQEGGRKFDLVFQRTDATLQIIRIGTSRASRDPVHLARLLLEKIDTVDPGFGIERATLIAWRVAPLLPRQTDTYVSAVDDAHDLGELIDRIGNRIGARNVYRVAPVESDIPERAVEQVAPITEVAVSWPTALPRPLRLLSPPELVEVTALLPDYPPAMFAWRGETRKVRCADGPERIFGEWWRNEKEVGDVRDYFRVEDENGERFWLFRNRQLSPEPTYRWYLHGVFA
jgi:protein ImuB